MRTPHDQALRKQVYDYVSRLTARIRFSNGGGSNLEVAVQPNVQGPGVFLYMVENPRPTFDGVQPQHRTEKYVLLTAKNAKRLGHALLFMAGESEIDEQDEALTPLRDESPA